MAKKTNAQLEEENAQLLQENTDLKAKLEAGFDEAAKTTIAELQAANESKEKIIEVQSDKLEQLQKSLDAASDGKVIKAQTKSDASALEAVEFEGKTYTWTKTQFRVSGNPDLHKAEEAANNPELLKAILSIKGQTILKEQA